MMKRLMFLPLVIFLGWMACAQQNAVHWFNPVANGQPFISGRGWNTGLSDDYDRLPAKAENTVRTAVWNLAHNTAGEYVDFKTSAKTIFVRYQVKSGLNMPHMPSTGVSGMDLYAKDSKGNWLWAKEKYSFGDTVTYKFENIYSANPIAFFRIYLPLYNTVKWMEIGVEGNEPVTPVTNDQPALVLYGTSILQGGCTSRPGLAWTNTLGRQLNLPVINLGFSGNGKLEMPLIDLINETNARLFVLDCLPNLASKEYSNDTIAYRILQCVHGLRAKHPNTPILLTEHASGLSSVSLDSSVFNDCNRINKVLEKTFAEMKGKGVKNIWLLTAKEIGFGTSSTVDGIHPNDIGMMQYAEAYTKKIRSILNEK